MQSSVRHKLSITLKTSYKRFTWHQKMPPEVFWKKGLLKNFTKFTGKRLCWSLFFNEVAGLPATLLKKRLQHRCFPVNFVKFSRTPFFYRTPPVAAFVFNSSGDHWFVILYVLISFQFTSFIFNLITLISI